MAPSSISEASETIVNPNDGLNIPDWIKEDLFQEILEADIPGYSKIKRFLPIAAIGPGENYTSRMLRIHIDVELKDGSTVHTSYIVKTAIESQITKKFIDSVNAFPKEKQIYETILPKYEQLYAEAGKTIKFGPSCKYVQDTPEHITIVMEDLRRRNFSNVDRLEGLDLAHITPVLRKLAELHAASAVYCERFGPYSKELSTSFFAEEHREMFKKFGSGTDDIFIAVLPKWGDCERYIPLWPNPDKLFDWFVRPVDPTEFNVLNHGDCWSNNIMFQHNDEGDVTETYFIDYQITYWGTPALDLGYLITASAHYDLRIKQFDRLVRIYHEHLAENLKLLKYSKPIPTLKDIHIHLIKYSLFSFFTATSILTAIMAEPDKKATADNLIGKNEEAEEFRQQILTNPRFVKAMKQLLPWWENRGMFEF